jgi:hypothetical protein
MASYPALIAGAMIFAIIVVQIRDKEYNSLLLIILFSLPILSLLIYLSYKNFDLLGYVLIIIPIVLVYIGYKMGIKQEEPAPVILPEPTPAPAPVPAPEEEKCNRCAKVPCLCPVKKT